MNQLSEWARNHESRLQVLADDSLYSYLSDEDLSFESFLSTNNNGLLTSSMWNDLLAKLTNIITNHEMRLRKIEWGNGNGNGVCELSPYWGVKWCATTAYNWQTNNSDLPIFLEVPDGVHFEEYPHKPVNALYYKKWELRAYIDPSNTVTITSSVGYDSRNYFVFYRSSYHASGTIFCFQNNDGLNGQSTSNGPIYWVNCAPGGKRDLTNYYVYNRMDMAKWWNVDLACKMNCDRDSCKCTYNQIYNAYCYVDDSGLNEYLNENIKTKSELKKNKKDECWQQINENLCQAITGCVRYDEE